MTTIRPSPKTAIFLSCFLLVTGLTAVDFFNPSLPYMMADLHASQTQIKSLIVVYMLVLGVAQFFYGSLSDHCGRRPAVVLSFVFAALGLAVSAFALSVTALYLARALTAFGTAGCTVISRAVIVDTIDGEQAIKKAFSYFAKAGQISPSLAPLAGGCIQQHFGWRWSFVTLAVLMVSAWLALLICMPETREPQPKQHAELFFIKPYVELTADFRFMAYSLLSALVFVFTIGHYTTSPFAFHALGDSPVQNSLFYLTYAAAMLAGAWAMGNLLVKVRSMRLYLCTLVYYLAACVLFRWFDVDTSGWKIAAFSFMLGFGSVVAAPLALVLSMSVVEKNRRAASALQGAVKMFFTGVCMMLFYLARVRTFSSLLDIFLIVALLLTGIFATDRGRVQGGLAERLGQKR
ncbi:MFS transporter [Pandoraea sputorum]|uniref:MFS transporter n=1 Tax=Pandoraea sputorum TaxID=93222 RepID=UPI001241F903|nr:MFS transporter [Pandoraea sputorum]VVE54983.1 Drug resistance transporter Bcr/CflA subfamily protein [Pandoraea sputorum]